MKKTTKLTASLLGILAFTLFGTGCGDDHADHDHDHEHGEHHEDGDDKSTSAGGGDDGYPLTTCVVSGEDLGSMGTPVVIQHEGTTVKFCCDSCIDDFKKEPATYLAKLNAAKQDE